MRFRKSLLSKPGNHATRDKRHQAGPLAYAFYMTGVYVCCSHFGAFSFTSWTSDRGLHRGSVVVFDSTSIIVAVKALANGGEYLWIWLLNALEFTGRQCWQCDTAEPWRFCWSNGQICFIPANISRYLLPCFFSPFVR